MNISKTIKWKRNCIWLLVIFFIFLPLLDRAKGQQSISDVSSQRLLVGGDANKCYFLIRADKDRPVPEDGFKLLVVMPGGDGSAEFNPFVRRIYKNALPEEYLVAELVAVKWMPQQQIIWPTKKDKVAKQRFSTEEFVEEVIKELKAEYKLNEEYIFTLSWSSSGPAAYALSLQKQKSVTGSFIAMSVFKPGSLPVLEAAKSHIYYLYHSPEDKVCPFWMANAAKKALEQNGAKVKLVTYSGGHGWHGNVYGDIKSGIEWLESQVKLKGKEKQKGKEMAVTDANQIEPEGKIVLYDDFEAGQDTPDGWGKGADVDGVNYRWDKRIGYRSKSSLCFTKTVNKFIPIAQWHKTIKLKNPKERLKVTIQVRAIKASKATVDIQFLDEDGKWIEHQWAAYIGAKEAADLPANHNWKEYYGIIDIPETARQITIALQMYGPGSVWFDDLKVEYVD